MESFFLKHLSSTGITKKLDDDCFHLHMINKHYIIATDSFIENIHFYTSKKPHNNHTTNIYRYNHPNDWLGYNALARKAFLVNISDIISSNAKPIYALLAITLPSHLSKSAILDIIHGIESICKQYNIYLIGGDTTKGDRLIFNITLIGKLMGKYIGRDSVRDGDLLAYTSTRQKNIGTSLKTLKALLRYGSLTHINPSSRFYNPILRYSFMKKAHKYINACMDISDGLSSEIQRLQDINKLHFRPFATIPKHIYQSGEEYELLFSFNAKYKHALNNIAKSCRISLHIIGSFSRYSKTYMSSIKWH